MKQSVSRKLVMNIVFFLLVIGVIIFVIRDSLGEIFEELGRTSLPVLVGVTALGLAGQLVEGSTIKSIATKFKPEFSLVDGFFASAYSIFYRVVTFGTGSIVAEVAFYHKKGLSYPEGAGTSAIRMIFYKMALVIWALLFLIIKSDAVKDQLSNGLFFIILGIVVTLLIVGFLLLLSLSLNVQVLFVSLAHRLVKKKKLRNVVDKLNTQIYVLRESIQRFTSDRTAAIRTMILSLAKLALWYSLPYFILMKDYPKINPLLIIALISFSVILGGVLPAPGGIGGFEFVYVLLFRGAVGKVDAVSSLLLYRYATYLLPFLIGMLYVLVTKQRQIHEEIKEVKEEKEVEELKEAEKES